MNASDKINILVVDDQAPKLLTLETILGDLGENVLQARSAEEALRLLLAYEFAVVLVDVCMPQMDGFELAELIRQHPRCSRTAIIFISAVHLTDEDRLRGYGLGAVDYIPVPIIPQVLRAKVAVFAELYRKRGELERLNRSLEQRVSERTQDLEATNARLRESEVKFRTLADNIAQMAWMADASGCVTWCNQRWFEYTGLTEEQSLGWGWTNTIHPEHAERVVRKIADCFRSGEAWEDTFPTRGADGGFRWFLCRAFPVRDAHAAVERWFGTGTDITEQREAQQVLARDRETLEQLVAVRTAQLERSTEKLRIADRMATIGTLSAGLGHDMANLLLPVRMRLDAVAASDMCESAREDIAAIRSACDYLQRLAQSLRLLAIDPEKRDPRDSGTDILSWWVEAEAMIRNGIVRPATLQTELKAPLPRVAIGRAALTQIVFNLVQNAGEALRGREGACVRISAAAEQSGIVRLCVADNGPGMDEATRSRCMEPFFTTKTRGMSTGLGLALVAGLVKGVGGSIEVVSEPGAGAAFHLLLPAERAPSPAATASAPRGAAVTLTDRRLASFLSAVLREQAYEPTGGPPGDGAELWITDAPDDTSRRSIIRVCMARPSLRVVVLAEPEAPDLPGVTRLDLRQKPSALAAALRGILAARPDTLLVTGSPHARVGVADGEHAPLPAAGGGRL